VALDPQDLAARLVLLASLGHRVTQGLVGTLDHKGHRVLREERVIRAGLDQQDLRDLSARPDLQEC